jgi:hypothetical protein
MFLQSSKGRRSKILAAIEADEDYRASRTKLDKGISHPIIEDNNTKILKKALKYGSPEFNQDRLRG